MNSLGVAGEGAIVYIRPADDDVRSRSGTFDLLSCPFQSVLHLLQSRVSLIRLALPMHFVQLLLPVVARIH